MKRRTLLLILFAIFPLWAMAADPAPPEVDWETRLNRAPQDTSRAAPEGKILSGPEDFLPPAPADLPRAVTAPASSESITGTRQPSAPSVLEGF
jgi:hypothetical protein